VASNASSFDHDTKTAESIGDFSPLHGGPEHDAQVRFDPAMGS